MRTGDARICLNINRNVIDGVKTLFFLLFVAVPLLTGWLVSVHVWNGLASATGSPARAVAAYSIVFAVMDTAALTVFMTVVYTLLFGCDEKADIGGSVFFGFIVASFSWPFSVVFYMSPIYELYFRHAGLFDAVYWAVSGTALSLLAIHLVVGIALTIYMSMIWAHVARRG